MSDYDLSSNLILKDVDLDLYLEKRKIQEFLREKIDSDIGYYYWKNYIVSAFWSNVATPLNLTITFLTAITTAQSQNIQLIPESIFSNLTVINLVITTLITFFRPHEQCSNYSEFVKQWVELGVDLEKEFSAKAVAKGEEVPRYYHLKKLTDKIEIYKEIQNRCVEMRKNQNKNVINSFTDLIFVIVYYVFMCRMIKGPKRWLDYDRKIYLRISEAKPTVQGADEKEIKNEIVNSQLSTEEVSIPVKSGLTQSEALQQQD